MVILFSESTFKTRRTGAYRIATILRDMNIDVEVIDFLSEWNIDNLISILDKIDDIDWVGFSLTYSYFLEGVNHANRFTDLSTDDEVKLLSYLKERQVPIVLGGANADAIKNFVSGYYIVVGYADNALPVVHNHIVEGHPVTSTNVNGNTVIYSDANYADIDLSKVETRFIHNDLIDSNEILPIEISRGCIFKCKFCEFPYLGKKPGTYIRTKESIASDIQRAYTDYNIENFLFVDDTFNDSVYKMQLVADIRKETNIPFTFWSYGRLDLLAANPEMVDLIGPTGWNAVTFGVETLNRKSGSKIGKGADPERLKQTLVEIRNRYPSMHIQVNLISGLVDSTKEDIKESIDWFLDNNVANYINIAPLHIRDIRNVTSGSELAKQPNKFGYQIISTDSLRYDWKNNNWSTSEAQKFASEMTAYIASKRNNMWSYHYEYHIKRFIKQGLNRAQIIDKLKSYASSMDYIERKTNILLERTTK